MRTIAMTAWQVIMGNARTFLRVFPYHFKTKTMNYFSDCCGAPPYLNNIDLERCSDCKENCEFEQNNDDELYQQFLNLNGI